MPRPRRQTAPNPGASAEPPPPAKTPRGDVVIRRVLAAARALLTRYPSRAVSVVEIAKKAKVPRASLLLQFPDGMADIVSRLIYDEYMAAFGLDEPQDLWSASQAFMADGNHQPGPAAALLPLERLIDRSLHAGLLYRNLQSEAFQFTGPLLEEQRDRLGFMAMYLLFRLDSSPDVEVTLDAIYLAETLVRLAWDLAAGPWFDGPNDAEGSGRRTDVLRAAFQSLVPELRSLMYAGKQMMSNRIDQQQRTRRKPR